MSSHWPTADQQPGATPAEIEFARRWQDMPKVVFFSTLSTVGWNTRPGHRRRGHRDHAAHDLGWRAGLIDEYAIVTHPVLVGGGTPFFTALGNRVNLNLVETGRFPTAWS